MTIAMTPEGETLLDTLCAKVDERMGLIRIASGELAQLVGEAD